MYHNQNGSGTVRHRPHSNSNGFYPSRDSRSSSFSFCGRTPTHSRTSISQPHPKDLQREQPSLSSIGPSHFLTASKALNPCAADFVSPPRSSSAKQRLPEFGTSKKTTTRVEIPLPGNLDGAADYSSSPLSRFSPAILTPVIDSATDAFFQLAATEISREPLIPEATAQEAQEQPGAYDGEKLTDTAKTEPVITETDGAAVPAIITGPVSSAEVADHAASEDRNSASATPSEVNISSDGAHTHGKSKKKSRKNKAPAPPAPPAPPATGEESENNSKGRTIAVPQPQGAPSKMTEKAQTNHKATIQESRPQSRASAADEGRDLPISHIQAPKKACVQKPAIAEDSSNTASLVNSTVASENSKHSSGIEKNITVEQPAKHNDKVDNDKIRPVSNISNNNINHIDTRPKNSSGENTFPGPSLEPSKKSTRFLTAAQKGKSPLSNIDNSSSGGGGTMRIKSPAKPRGHDRSSSSGDNFTDMRKKVEKTEAHFSAADFPELPVTLTKKLGQEQEKGLLARGSLVCRAAPAAVAAVPFVWRTAEKSCDEDEEGGK